jgi:hypothetical protein
VTVRYSVALFVPFVVRVSGITAQSPAEAIERASAFARQNDWLQRPVKEGAHDCGAQEPTLCYVEPHDPGEPIGAMVDVVDSEAGEVLWDHPETDRYYALDALSLYRSLEDDEQ